MDGQKLNAGSVQVRKHEGILLPLVESKRSWDDDIKMDLQEVGRVWRWLDSCGSGYEQVAGSCEYGK